MSNMSNIESEKYDISDKYLQNIDINEYIDISKNIIMNIQNLINLLVFEIEVLMKKIEENKQEINDFEKIKVNIDKINNLIYTNNLNKDKFKIIEALEELNNTELKNEELIKIAISIYKKNFIGIFKNTDLRVNIVNRNFYEFILNKIKQDELTERYKNRIIKLFLEDD
jgi:hypothetical protein